jgi:hypothetical protein
MVTVYPTGGVEEKEGGREGGPGGRDRGSYAEVDGSVSTPPLSLALVTVSLPNDVHANLAKSFCDAIS